MAAIILLLFLSSSICCATSTSGAAGEMPPTDPHAALKNPQFIAPDILRILQRGSLTIAVLKYNAPPFIIKNSAGKESGLDIDILQGFADILGLKLNFNQTAETYEELVDLVAGNQADIAACGISRTLQRAMSVNFTRPYLKLQQGLLINRVALAEQVHGHSWDEVIKDLRGSLGVLSGSSYVQFARHHLNKMELKLFPDMTKTKKAVFNGTVTAAYLDELDIKMLIRNQPNQALRCQTVLFKDVPDFIAFPVSQKKPQLLRLLNIYIEEHPVDLTIDQIVDKYLPAVDTN